VNKSAFRSDLQGLRVLAFLSIAIWHLTDTSLLVGSITVFFVLTTYFQARKIRRIQNEKSTLQLPAEVVRVVWRLFAHVHLVIILVVIWMLYRAPISVKELWLESAFYMSSGLGNWFQIELAQDYWKRDAQLSPFFHLWAMSAQVQIIVILLTLGFILSLIKVNYPVVVKRVAWFALCVVAIALLVDDIMNYTQNTETHLSTWTWLWAFCFGVLFAYTDVRLPENLFTKIVSDVVFFAIVAIGIVGLFDISVFGIYTKNAMLLLVLVPLFTNFKETATTKLLESSAFQKLAYSAFGVYLWHWAIMQIVKNELAIDVLTYFQIAIVLALSFGLSLMSTFVIDVCTRYIERLSTVAMWFVKLLILSIIPLVLFWLSASSVQTISPDAPGSDLRPPLAEAQDDKPNFYDDPLCNLERDYTCQYGDPNSDVHLVLFGSSLAGNWEPALQKIVQDRGWLLDIRIRLGCPSSEDKEQGGSCSAWLNRTGREIIEMKPDIVLVNLTRADDGETAEALDSDYKRWKVFTDEGIAVAALRGSTTYPGNPLDCIEAAADPVQGCLFNQRFNYSELSEITAPLKKFSPSVEVIDLISSFCRRGSCLAVTLDNVIVYRDPFHTTRTFSRTLAGPIASALDSILSRKNSDL